MKSVIMVGGGIQQVPAVKRIQDLGYKVIVTDRNSNAPAFPSADVTANIDASDVESLIAWVLNNNEKHQIAGIFTLINHAPAVARVASATGLPTLDSDIVVGCDNKMFMKRKFKEYQLPTADFVEVSSLKEAQEAFDKFNNKRLFLKAADSCGGKGVREIRERNDLERTYEAIRKISAFPTFIFEECLEGDFIDAQGVFYDGVFYRAGIADSFFTTSLEKFRAFNPVEDFNVSPSQHKKETIDEVYLLLEKAARKFGIEWGPVGGDFVLTDGGLKIIEIAPRLHGPNGSLQIFPASTGINPLEFMVQCIAGDKPDARFLEPTYNDVALCKVFVSDKRNIKEVKFKTDPKKLEGVFSWFIYWDKNRKQSFSEVSLSGLASVFVKGQNYVEAAKRLKVAEEAFEII